MGISNSSQEMQMARKSSRKKLKQNLACPICNYMFYSQTFTYEDFDKHIEAHQVVENETTRTQSLISENVTYPESEKKIKPIRKKLEKLRVHWSNSFVDLYISRETLLNDSLNQILLFTPWQLRSEFHIIFFGEVSQDAGGLTKEWLGLAIKELFSEKLGLFRLGNCENPCYLPTAHNTNTPLYFLAGVIIGKAILENIPLDCALSRSILKQILGLTLRTRDIKYQDAHLYKSLRYLQRNKIDGIFFETFSVNLSNKIVPLVDDGQDISVTDQNKELYLLVRTEYELYGCMLEAVDSLKKGFYSVVPFENIQGLKADDLNFMLCGNPVINLKDWKENTEYTGEYSVDHKVIVWFWEIVFALSKQMQRDLLQFVTGTSRVPIEGFAALKTIRGDKAAFKIVSIEYSKGILPRSHTCFNRLDLPKYPSKDLLRTCLENVLENHLFGFGLD